MPVVKRTDYWNPATNSPFTTATGKGESYTDLEEYLLPIERAGQAALHDRGVAAGLEVSATVGGTSATVSIGVAFDGSGRAIVLARHGLAITNPEDDPAAMPYVAPVSVGVTGVTVTTTDLAPTFTGAALLTVSWREVEESGQPVLLHAPWLRLVPATGFVDDGTQVVLAAVTLGAGGVVDNLEAGTRRLVGLPVSRLELRRPRTTSGTVDSVDQVAGAAISARPDGGLDVSVLGPGAPAQPAISVDGTTGDVSLTRSFRVRDRFTVDGTGNVGVAATLTAAQVAVGTAQPRRVVHVEGSEVHSGGNGGGFSFADRTQAGQPLVEIPGAGERWVWYAQSGAARLWSGTDRLSVSAVGEGGGLDVGRRMRVRQGTDASAGIWLHQSGPNADRAFVGMADDGRVGFWGNAGLGWGLTMNVATGELQVKGAVDLQAGVDVKGAARLRNGAQITGNLTVGSGGDGQVKTRHVVGKSYLNDNDDDLYLNWSSGRWVHVGGAAEAGLEVVGPTTLRRNLSVAGTAGIGGGLTVGGSVSVGADQHVAGTLVAEAGGSFGGFPGWSGGGVGSWDIFAKGGVYVGTDPANPKVKIWNDGTISGVTKRFVIDHPLDPEHKSLQHTSIEGPEAGVYYRGEARLTAGRARVVLPAYFEALTRAQGRTVMLTPICEPGAETVDGAEGPVGTLGATRVERGGFDVLAGPGCSPSQAFCWEVKAVRADVETLDVEVEKAATTVMFERSMMELA